MSEIAVIVSFVVKGLIPPKGKAAQEETEKQNENAK
jgi:hypothetical protein